MSGTGIETITGPAEEIRDRVRRFEGTGLRTFYTPNPLVWERTSGAEVWDVEGRRYVDLHGGFAVAAVGYCHPKVTEAITRQVGQMTHTPTAVPSAVRASFYEALASIIPAELSRFFPSSTGAFANELAVGLARAATGRSQIIAFTGGYAGRTWGTLGVAGKVAYRKGVGAMSDAYFLSFPDPYRHPWGADADPVVNTIALLEEMVHDPASGLDPVAGIMVEPIQGNGGVVRPDDRFLRELRRICDDIGAVLIFDEIQSGFGRAGVTWAREFSGAIPDLMTIGKGIGGGMPIAAVVGREDLMTHWPEDTVAGTFIAHALPMVAATAAVGVLKSEGLVERSREYGAAVSARLAEGLADSPIVGEIRGSGLFIGVELVENRETKVPATAIASAVAIQMRDSGYILGRCGRYANVLKFTPPLNIEREDLDAGVDLLVKVLCEHTSSEQRNRA